MGNSVRLSGESLVYYALQMRKGSNTIQTAAHKKGPIHLMFMVKSDKEVFK